LVEFYRLMYASRRIDDREIMLKRQQKIFFQISAAGHEALQVAAGLALRPGYDWFVPYYRDRALCLALGVTAEEMLLQAVGAEADPASGGRQMPAHWSSPKLHIVSTSSSTATQVLHAVGVAESGRYYSRFPEAAEKPTSADYRAFHDVEFQADEVVLTCIGEGATSQGEFWEALNTASNQKLPVIFCVEDNGYAISVPVEVNTPGGNISKLVANFPNFFFAEVDGTDPEASYHAFVAAAEHCRAGKGPAFVHGHCVRVYSHSFSDDDKKYRLHEEREADAMRDPLHKLQMRLLREGILSTSELNALELQIDDQIAAAAVRAVAAPTPEISSIPKHIYSEDFDPTRSDLTTEPKRAREGKEGKADSERTMADLINLCLRDEMRRDLRILVYGEDVADATSSP
jgi:2-oxoisovalerate dehydrogenase E1 component